MRRTKLERADELEVKIHEMQNERKTLLQGHKEDERKNRTRRLCKHAAVLENVVPETASMNDEQLKWLFEQTLTTDFANTRIGWAKTRKTSQPSQNQTSATVHESQSQVKPTLLNTASVTATKKVSGSVSNDSAGADIA